MRGYAKIWTDCFNDPWFLSLSALQRGIWLQLIIYAKMVGDTGVVSGRSISSLAVLSGCDDSSMAKNLRKFAIDERITLKEQHRGRSIMVTIEILNYEYYQRVRDAKEHPNSDKDVCMSMAKNRHISRPDQSNSIIKNNTITVNGEKSPHKSNIEEFIDIYNELCPFGAKATLMSKQRLRHISAALKRQPDLGWWRKLIAEKVATSPFLCGEVPPMDEHRQFKLTIDWLVNENNLLKIQEGRYEEQKPKRRGEPKGLTLNEIKDFD